MYQPAAQYQLWHALALIGARRLGAITPFGNVARRARLRA